MEPKGIFRKVPSKEFVEEILILLQFNGLNDYKTFVKEDISITKFEEIIPFIYPYYIPCKASRFLSDLNYSKQITILRHLLRSIGYDLFTQEKLFRSVKVNTYKIYKKIISDLSSNYIIDFN